MFTDANQLLLNDITNQQRKWLQGEALTYKFYAKMKKPTTNQFFQYYTWFLQDGPNYKAGGIRF